MVMKIQSKKEKKKIFFINNLLIWYIYIKSKTISIIDVVISTVTSYDDFPEYRTKDMNLPEYQNLLLGTNHGEAFKLTVYSNNELKIKNIFNPVTISNSIYIDYYEGSDYFFSSGEMSDGYVFSVSIKNFFILLFILFYFIIVILIYIYIYNIY